MVEKRFQMKDADLFNEVQKLMNGNYDSYQNVYELSKKYIYKIINDVVKNHHTTEDLMQETYLQVYRKIDTLMEAKAFYVWAGRIATNLSLRHLQKNKKEELHPTILEEDDDKAYTVFDEAAQDMEAFIPETVLENAEQQRIIAGILEGLSVEQKLCVQYYYFEELSVNDIAKLMQCSTGTVKSRLNYARKSLKEAINTFEIKNDVKLYSMASLPVFLLVFKKAADSLVFSSAAIGAGAIVAGGVVAEEALVGGGTAGTAGAASGSAAGVASGGSVVAGGTAVSGTAVAGTGATAATATGFMATVTGKVAVVVTAVCVSAGSAAVSTEISKNEMMENYGHIITSEEAQESIYSSMNMLSPQSQMAYTQNIQELIGDVEISEYEMALVNEEYLEAIDNLAAAMVRYEEALRYSMTAEQYAYVDEIMSAYYAEVENYLSQGVQYGMIETADTTGTFAMKYLPELTDLINEETRLINTFADIYSTMEVKSALHKHTAGELKSVLEMGGGAGDLIANDISEKTFNHIIAISQDYFALIDKLTAWSEKVMNDPNLKQYFVQ